MQASSTQVQEVISEGNGLTRAAESWPEVRDPDHRSLLSEQLLQAPSSLSNSGPPITGDGAHSAVMP